MIHNAVEDFQERLNKYKTNQEIEWYDLQNSFEASRVFDRAEKSTIELPEVEIQAEKIITIREQIAELAELFIELLPESEALYPTDMSTDESLEQRICELIREAALEGVHDELPHSLAVTIDEMGEREDGSLYDIHANVWVERDSQKGIIIGKQGTRLKEVGQTARLQIEKLLGVKVYLDLRVKVAPDWQRDPKQLNRLGF
jgi:GTP-binding protein Era